MTYLLFAVILSPLTLAILFPLAIQYERGWKVVYPLYLFAFVLDIIANYTWFSLVYCWPMSGEYTVSKRLRRVSSFFGWRGALASIVIDYINFWKQGHIP